MKPLFGRLEIAEKHLLKNGAVAGQGMFIDVQRVIFHNDREMTAIHFAGTRENPQPGVEIFYVIQYVDILIPE